MANVKGGVQGAGQGAAAGSAFGPWGAVIGGAIGGAAGLMSDDPAEVAAQAGKDYTKAVSEATDKYVAQGNEIIDPLVQLSNRSQYIKDFDSYTGALRDSDPTKYNINAVQLQQENPLAKVGQYLDPSINYQMQQARKGVEESAAGQGGLFAGAAGQAISDATRRIAETGWGDAYSRANAMEQRQNALLAQQQGLDMSAGQYNLSNDRTRLGNLGQAYNTSVDPVKAMMDAKLGFAGTQYGAETGAAGTTYQSKVAQANSGEDPLAGVTDIINTVGKIKGGK